MGLTYRQTKGSALTIQELDANFEYFTGSHSITGSVIISGSQQIIGSVEITGSLNILSGSIYGTASYAQTASYYIAPTGSSIPTGSAPEGSFTFVVDSGNCYVCAYINGSWKTGSLG